MSGNIRFCGECNGSLLAAIVSLHLLHLLNIRQLECQTLLACVRYVPLGLASWFKGVGVQNVHEMGWWQEAQLPQSSITLACVPAQVLPLPLITMLSSS